MAVFRVEKNHNYTVMSNYHLRDIGLTLKAIGLLSKMLSLTDEWDYTTRGLAAICKEGVDAIGAAEHPHSFLSVTKGGISAIVTTTGNEDCHIILRGGKEPNYDAESVKAACELLKAAGHREMVMIDASHSNSKKICRNQILVVDDICAQVADGSSAIIGVMIESNLVEGRQDITPDKPLTYGQSVTDACLGWDDTVKLLEKLARAVRDRRSRNC